MTNAKWDGLSLYRFRYRNPRADKSLRGRYVAKLHLPPVEEPPPDQEPPPQSPPDNEPPDPPVEEPPVEGQFDRLMCRLTIEPSTYSVVGRLPMASRATARHIHQ
jgi:hypothetical protein